MANRKYRKAINFDLFSDKLIVEFGKNGRTNAYRMIRTFLQSNGFSHRQGSGYLSRYPLSDKETFIVLNDMNDKYEWLGDCLNKLDMTNILREFDMSYIYRDIDIDLPLLVDVDE
jgi:virulence-associated protein VapD